MLSGFFQICIAAMLVLAGSLLCCAQSADNSAFSRDPNDKTERSKNIQESLEKMRIEKEKKDFEEMLDRGQQAVRISEELETAVLRTGRLSEKEATKLANVEKLVKKIRSELGGDGEDGEEEIEAVVAPVQKMPLREAITTLKSTTVDLYEELKKTSRFTISAAAIQTSNAVLMIVKFLRLSK
ncbi:hypothetical protein BH10ACI3_BH10ACI3_05720 [soil metagenome]